MIRFNVSFRELTNKFDVCFNESKNNFITKFGDSLTIKSDVEDYKGVTTVTPLPRENVVLKTKQKKVLDDITVLKIPYFETSNQYGSTVYIGGN